MPVAAAKPHACSPPPAADDTPVVSAATLRAEAEQLRALFAGTYEAWETAGSVRRNQPGQGVTHLVRVAPAWAGRVAEDPVSARADELVVDYQVGSVLGRTTLRVRGPTGVSHCTVGCVLYLGRVHWMWRAAAAAWGPMLAWATGPASYWDLLRRRLVDAGRLCLDGESGAVCWHRPRGGCQPFDCPTEAEFFLLARTKWTPPPCRYNGAVRRWRQGLRREWYPPSVPLTPAGQTPRVFDLSRHPQPRKETPDHGDSQAPLT